MKEVNYPNQLLTFLKEAKIDGLPKEWLVDDSILAKQTEKEDMRKQQAVRAEENIIHPESSLDWSELRAKAEACKKCRLCEGRNKVVFGVGNIKAKLVFVGEGPGADEDKTGEPFVGRAGQLLTAAITKGMGLTREDVYIANVVKCRPPENRAPLPDETAACTPYLYRQLELMSPQVIVTLGQPAQMALSGVDTWDHKT